MDWINKYIYIIFCILFCRCSSAPQKIEDYIDKNDFKNSIMELKMKDVLGDYDRIYIVESLTPLSGVIDMLNVSSYREVDKNEVLGNNSDSFFIFLVKNRKVVYEEEFDYHDTKVLFDLDSFEIAEGTGWFDNDKIIVHGYFSNNSIFLIKNIDGHFLVCNM